MEVHSHIQITMKDTIRLSRVQMPDELPIGKWCCWRHHAIDPLRVEQGLVDIWRAVVPLALHVQVVRALQWNRARATNLVCADCTREGDLACHAGTADDGLVEIQLLDQSGDAADVGVFVVGVLAWPIAFVLCRTLALQPLLVSQVVLLTGNDRPCAGRSKEVIRSFSRARGSFITLCRTLITAL